MLSFLCGCSEKTANPNKEITMDAFSEMKAHAYSVSSYKIREHIDSLCQNDHDSTMTDYRVRSYYLNRKPFLWIDRHGIDSNVDTLLLFLDKVDEMGFTRRSFCVKKIKRDVERLRNLNFDSVNTINKVLARLEYRLTKAYLRYTTGQRFGFVNPTYVFNNMDVLDKDSVRTHYRKLFDISMQHPRKKFFELALKQIDRDKIKTFLMQVQPTNPYYYELERRLNGNNKISASERMTILCNMERCRWREKQKIPNGGKYVVVNIPAYKLFAYGDGAVVTMRIGCGAVKTKTPLLSSSIYRLDVNPRWNVPMSIVKKDIARHAGSRSYFDRHNMFVTYKKTGERVDIAHVTYSMLLGGDYRVVQEGGPGNSLGRIIFRFPNSFSVYLHDTSTKEVFDRDDRGVSHGCVRVEHPFQLAQFVVGDDDELIDEIRTLMGLDENGLPLPDDEEDSPNKKVKMKCVDVKRQIPLFITYYTLYKDESGNIQSYPDVYGYDRIIAEHIKPYLK